MVMGPGWRSHPAHQKPGRGGIHCQGYVVHAHIDLGGAEFDGILRIEVKSPASVRLPTPTTTSLLLVRAGQPRDWGEPVSQLTII
jgi:hypothetical protein